MKEETISEKELLAKISRGDAKAMHHLYERYVGYVMAVCLRYIPDRDEVRDVVQDSFIKIFSSIPRFEYRGEGSLKAWLLRIAANEAISYAKSKLKFVFVDEVPDEPEQDEPPVERLPPDVLTRLIGELPVGYRLVLNMYVFEQKSHKEIARELNIKESTSASQYLRAKKLLARKIKEYQNHHERE